MTEMLGVLAIIGILSIGGLLGYRYGMDKLRANELVHEMNMRLIALVLHLEKNPTDLTMELGNVTRQGFAIGTFWDAHDDRYFFMHVDKVPSGVCQQVVNLNWEAPIEIIVDDISISDNPDACSINKMVAHLDFKFDKFMDVSALLDDDEPSKPEETQTPEPDPCEGKPLYDGTLNCYACDEPQSLMNAYGCLSACPNRVEIYDGDSFWCALDGCPSNKPLRDYNGNCHACDTSSVIYVSDAAACSVCSERILDKNKCMLPCSPEQKLIGSNGICYDCNVKTIVDVANPTDCSVCENRTVVTQYGVRHSCYKNCPPETPLMDNFGNCYECDYQSTVSMYDPVKETCNSCENRYLKYSQCYRNCDGDKPITSSTGTCYACDYNGQVTVDASKGNCSACSERELVGNYCRLKECPEDKPLRSAFNACYACDYNAMVNVQGIHENCAVCYNRFLEGDNCVRSCTSDEPLRDNRGYCYNCDINATIWVQGVPENCSVCSNRKVVGEYCVKECSPVKPLMDSHGDCHNCNVSYAVDVGDNASFCDVCSNREMTGNFCALKCDAKTPLKDIQGYCYPCDTQQRVYVGSNSSACGVCSNLQYQDGYCITPCDGFVDIDGVCRSCGDIDMPFYVIEEGNSCHACSRYRKYPYSKLGEPIDICILSEMYDEVLEMLGLPPEDEL